MSIRFLIAVLTFVIISYSCKETKDNNYFIDLEIWDNPFYEVGSDKLLDFLADKEDYVLTICDANCSYCLGNLLNGMKQLIKNGEEKIFVVIPESSGKIVDFFFHQVLEDIENKVIIIENEAFSNAIFEKYNGIYYIIQNSNISSARYLLNTE